MHVEVDTDKPKTSMNVTKDTAISLAVLLPIIGLFIGGIMWFSTVHAKVDATKNELASLKREVETIQQNQKEQLERYIEIKVQLGKLEGMLLNKNK